MNLNLKLDEAKTIDDLKNNNLNVIALMSKNGKEINNPADSCITQNIKCLYSESIYNVI